MRIYFVGAHSCGKSTLARYCSETYQLPIITEVARTILAEKELQIETLRTDISVVNSFQKEVFHRQISEEAKLTSFVSDRSFDCLAYAVQHSTIFNKLFNSDELKKYIESLKKPDAMIFYIKPNKNTLKNDGVRENVIWDGVVAIDAIVKCFIQMFGLKCFQINMDSMQERIQFIDSILSLTTLNKITNKNI